MTDLKEDDSSTDNSSTSSAYSAVSGSVDFSDREERIAELLEYLKDDSSGYDSI